MKRSLKKYPKGGPIKPIVVSDPNDPRLRAYNDSNTLYNHFEDLNTKDNGFNNAGNTLNYSVPSKNFDKFLEEARFKEQHLQRTRGKFDVFALGPDITDEDSKKLGIKAGHNTGIKKSYTTQKQQQGILPEKYDVHQEINTNGTLLKISPRYKQPVQPVVYQKPTKPVVKAGTVKPSYQEYLKTVNPDFVGNDYNLEEAYKNLPLKDMQAWAKEPNKNHLPDTYKLPNHPTFSNESKYYKEGMPAGKWEGNNYVPINRPQVQPTEPPPVDSSPVGTYQGRQFMNKTGLRPGNYTTNQVDSATQETMKKRSLKKFLPGGLTGLQQNVPNVNPYIAAGAAGATGIASALGGGGGEAIGQGVGTGIGTAAGMALNAVVPGLGFIAAPILGKLGGMAGKAIGDKVDTSDDKAEAKRKALEASYSQYNDLNNTYSLQSNTGRGLAYAEGGITLNQDDPNATEELELNEQFQMPDGQVGEVDGPSHEMGGIQTNLPEGTRVFSDRLKHNGRTFAKIVKPINTQIAKVESNPHTSKTIKENTLMLLNKQLDQYFNIQETNKQNSEMKRSLKMAKGGVVKYADGGPVLGSLKPDGTPYTREELNNYYNVVQPVMNTVNPFSPEGSIMNTSNETPIKRNEDIKTPYTIRPKVATTLSPATPSLSTPGLSSVETPSSTGAGDSSFGSFLGNNAGQIGQIATAGLTTALQARNLNKLARPKTLAKIKLADKIANPNLVNYSGQREDINRTALSQMDQATRSLSNSATAQAFRNQANINRLRGTGQSWQDESNTNTQIKNQFLGQRNQASIQEELTNNDIDKYNLENQYNYDAFKTGQKGQIIGSLGETAGQVFGNQTKYQNQLDQAKILSHSYDPTVYRDANGNVIKKNSWGRNGGIVKRTLKSKK